MARATFPTEVKVGWTNYQIVQWDQKGSVAANRYGECSHTERVIRVAVGYGDRQAASTLLHEIIHAIFCIWQICDDDNEERTTKTLQQGLSTVWHDNPAVFDWIGQNLQAGT